MKATLSTHDLTAKRHLPLCQVPRVSNPKLCVIEDVGSGLWYFIRKILHPSTWYLKFNQTSQVYSIQAQSFNEVCLVCASDAALAYRWGSHVGQSQKKVGASVASAIDGANGFTSGTIYPIALALCALNWQIVREPCHTEVIMSMWY